MSTITATADHTSRMRRPARAALIVGLAVLSIVGLTSSPASAKSWSQTGSPGQVATSATATANGATRRITVNPTVVGQSAAYAHYDQYVCVTSRQWQIVVNPAGWQQVSSNRRCGWLLAGSGSAFTDWGATYSAYYGVGYSVTIDVTWQFSNGTMIGTKHIDFNSTSDYRCVNGNCYTAYTNWGGGAFVAFPSY